MPTKRISPKMMLGLLVLVTTGVLFAYYRLSLKPQGPGQDQQSAIADGIAIPLMSPQTPSEGRVPSEAPATTPSVDAKTPIEPPAMAASTQQERASIPGSRASGRWKFIPDPAAPASAWQDRIAELKASKSVVALEALIEAVPTGEARPHLLSAASAALASLGQEARLAFDDLLGPSEPRDVRFAAINAFVHAFPSDRGTVLTLWSHDPDRLIREKAEALQASYR